MSHRDPFSAYKSRLDALGFHPSRRLGQNFLLEPELHRRIVAAGGVQDTDVVLEVGAGLGFLTRELAVQARAVVAAEIDLRLCEFLRAELPRIPGGANVTLVPGDALARGGVLADALATALAAVRAANPTGALRVVANLPYAVTGPLLAALLADLEPMAAGMGLLVQAEVGHRLCATPGSEAYGALSVLVQRWYDARVDRQVGREVFRPRPNVDSVIVALAHRPGVVPPGPERRAFAAFVRGLFSGRRKKIRHTWTLACTAAGLPREPGLKAPWDSMRPAETSPQDFAALWAAARCET